MNFHGERRSNATHASTTDPDARLFRKGNGQEAKLCYLGHVLMENRHGLAVDGCLTRRHRLRRSGPRRWTCWATGLTAARITRGRRQGL